MGLHSRGLAEEVSEHRPISAAVPHRNPEHRAAAPTFTCDLDGFVRYSLKAEFDTTIFGGAKATVKLSLQVLPQVPLDAHPEFFTPLQLEEHRVVSTRYFGESRGIDVCRLQHTRLPSGQCASDRSSGSEQLGTRRERSFRNAQRMCGDNPVTSFHSDM